MRRRLGSILILLGAVALLLGAITVSRSRTLARAGSVQLTLREHRTPLVPRWVGAALCIAGVALVFASRRRHAALGTPDVASQLPEPRASERGLAEAGARRERAPQPPADGSGSDHRR